MTTIQPIETGTNPTARFSEQDFLKTIATSNGTPPNGELIVSSTETNDKATTPHRFKLNGEPLTADRIFKAHCLLADEKYQKLKPILSIKEYVDLFLKNPNLSRPISKYIVDAIEWCDKEYGSKVVNKLGYDLTEFAFLKMPWRPEYLRKKDQFYGHPLFWNRVVDDLKTCSNLDHFDHMICAHGDYSTGKSTAFDALIELLNVYSKTDEGALYALELVFDDKAPFVGFDTPGMRQSREELEINPIPEPDIVVRVEANQKSIPLFILPPEERRAIIEALKEQGQLPENYNEAYTTEFPLDHLSSNILDRLHMLYYEKEYGDGNRGSSEATVTGNGKGKSLRHLRAVRWFFSTDNGIEVKQPIASPDTVLKRVTTDVAWERLAPQYLDLLSGAGVLSAEGSASKTQIEILDDFGRGLERHKGLNDYLHYLRLLEKGKTTATTADGTTPRELTCNRITFATANDSRLSEMDKLDSENWEALKTRMVFFEVEHERCYGYLSELLGDKLDLTFPRNGSRNISPNVVDALSIFTTMTHVLPAVNDAYYNNLRIADDTKKSLAATVKSLTLLDKILLYNGDRLNDYETDPTKFRWGQAAADVLEHNVKFIAEEYNQGRIDDNLYLYEGFTGLPTRISERLQRAASQLKPEEPYTIIELFEILDRATTRGKKGFKYEDRLEALIEVLKKEKIVTADKEGKVSAFLSSSKILTLTKEHFVRKIKFDVSTSTGYLKSKADTLKDFERYIRHIRAFTQKETVPIDWRISKENEKPDETFMRGIEKLSNIPETRKDDFRGELMSKMGAWAVGHAGNGGESVFKHLGDPDLFKDFIDKLEAANIEANKAGITNFIQDIKLIISHNPNLDLNSIPELPERPLHMLNGEKDAFKNKLDQIMISLDFPKPTADLDLERKEALLNGLKGLNKKGYKDIATIKKEVFFAYGDLAS